MKLKPHLNRLKSWYKKYFVGKTIIHTLGHPPAELHKRIMHRGEKLVCIVFTNKRTPGNNQIPMTYVPFTAVTMMRRMPCLFVKYIYAAFGKRANGRTYKIAHK